MHLFLQNPTILQRIETNTSPPKTVARLNTLSVLFSFLLWRVLVWCLDGLFLIFYFIFRHHSSAVEIQNCGVHVCRRSDVIDHAVRGSIDTLHCSVGSKVSYCLHEHRASEGLIGCSDERQQPAQRSSPKRTILCVRVG